MLLPSSSHTGPHGEETLEWGCCAVSCLAREHSVQRTNSSSRHSGGKCNVGLTVMNIPRLEGNYHSCLGKGFYIFQPLLCYSVSFYSCQDYLQKNTFTRWFNFSLLHSDSFTFELISRPLQTYPNKLKGWRNHLLHSSQILKWFRLNPICKHTGTMSHAFQLLTQCLKYFPVC